MIRTDRSKFARSFNQAVLSVGVAGAMLLAAAQSHAVTVTQTNPGGSYAISDSITFTYNINNLGFPGLAVIAYSVSFDNTSLTYDDVNSRIKNRILKGNLDEGGNTPNNFGGMPRLAGPNGEPTPQNCTNNEDLSTCNQILFSWSSAPVSAWVEVSDQLLGTAIFIANSNGFHSIFPLTGQGTSLAQDAGSYANSGSVFNDITNQFVYRGRGGFWVPEPGIASLSLAAIVTLYAIRNRQRKH